MCLGIPARVVKTKGVTAIVDMGGVLKEVDASFTPVKPGEYVIVHAGTIISKLDPKTAEETLELWKEILQNLQS